MIKVGIAHPTTLMICQTITAMSQPLKKYLLTDYMIWVSFKVITKVSYDLAQTDNGTSSNAGVIEQCLSGVFEIFTAWFLGAIGSGIPLFSYGAIAAYIVLFFAIYSRNLSIAKSSLWAVLILTILTIWIESYLALFMGIISPPDSVAAKCDAGVNLLLIHFTIPLVGFLDLFFTGLRLLLTFSLLKELERILDVRGNPTNLGRELSINTGIEAAQISNTNNTTGNKNLLSALLRSFLWFGCGGYIYLGQSFKAILMTIVAIFCLLIPDGVWLFWTVYILGIIDTYRLTRRHNRYRQVRWWDISLNFYTLVLATLMGASLAAILAG
jgi:hypothetical protein